MRNSSIPKFDSALWRQPWRVLPEQRAPLLDWFMTCDLSKVETIHEIRRLRGELSEPPALELGTLRILEAHPTDAEIRDFYRYRRGNLAKAERERALELRKTGARK